MAKQNGQNTSWSPINKGFVENVKGNGEFMFSQTTSPDSPKLTLSAGKICFLGREQKLSRQRVFVSLKSQRISLTYY